MIHTERERNEDRLPKITPHVCRHTYCSNMAKSGMNPKVLQNLMGHSDISVTLNTYSHVQYEDAKAEVAKMTGKEAPAEKELRNLDLREDDDDDDFGKIYRVK